MSKEERMCVMRKKKQEEEEEKEEKKERGRKKTRKKSMCFILNALFRSVLGSALDALDFYFNYYHLLFIFHFHLFCLL